MKDCRMTAGSFAAVLGKENGTGTFGDGGKKLLFILASSSMMSIGLVNAGVLHQGVSATSDVGSFSSSWLPENAINQSGLLTGYVSGVTDFDTYFAASPTHARVAVGNTWFTPFSEPLGNFYVDLGGSFTLETLALWNEGQGGTQGIRNFNLWASDDASFTTQILLGTFTNITSGVSTHELFSFATTTASFIRIEILDNYGSNVTGIMELAFERVLSLDTDSDGDGVDNADDACPGTPAGEAVDLNGCADSQVDSDGDGFCDPDAPSSGPSACTGSDNCPNSDLSATIIIDSIDTGVENDLLDDGCTLSDLIEDVPADNPTVVDVVEFLVALKKDGIISGKDLGAILKALNTP